VFQQFLANRSFVSRDFKYPFVFSFGKCGFQLFAVLHLFLVLSGFMNLRFLVCIRTETINQFINGASFLDKFLCIVSGAVRVT
jgi:hypothetical protein